jgi:putative FmdB family regulatory protein
MPTYEYECQSCHQHVEAVQKFSDPDLTVCAHCGGELRKVFSAVGIVFKGSGFYKTDSRGSSSGTPPSTPASAPTSPTTPAAPATEKKVPEKSAPATSATNSD